MHAEMFHKGLVLDLFVFFCTSMKEANPLADNYLMLANNAKLIYPLSVLESLNPSFSISWTRTVKNQFPLDATENNRIAYWCLN